MPSGILAAFNLAAGIPSSFTVPANKVGMCGINLCNRGPDAAAVRIAMIPGALGALGNAHYLEYDFQLPANTPIERTALAVAAGHTLLVQSDKATVSAGIYGALGTAVVGETMHGIFGCHDLTVAGGPQTGLTAVPAGKAGAVNVNLCNRTSGIIKVRLAVVPTGADIGACYWEYDAEVQPNSALERSGIPVSAGHTVVYQSNADGVSAQCYGFIGVPVVGEE